MRCASTSAKSALGLKNERDESWLPPESESEEGGLPGLADRSTPVGTVKALRGLRPRRALRSSPESPSASL